MMKKILSCYLFIIFVSTLLFSSKPPLEISAALRDETCTITTTNWTDNQVHQ